MLYPGPLSTYVPWTLVKFEETRYIGDRVSCVHRRGEPLANIIAVVSDSAAENQELSICRC